MNQKGAAEIFLALVIACLVGVATLTNLGLSSAANRPITEVRNVTEGFYDSENSALYSYAKGVIESTVATSFPLVALYPNSEPGSFTVQSYSKGQPVALSVTSGYDSGRTTMDRYLSSGTNVTYHSYDSKLGKSFEGDTQFGTKRNYVVRLSPPPPPPICGVVNNSATATTLGFSIAIPPTPSFTGTPITLPQFDTQGGSRVLDGALITVNFQTRTDFSGSVTNLNTTSPLNFNYEMDLTLSVTGPGITGGAGVSSYKNAASLSIPPGATVTLPSMVDPTSVVLSIPVAVGDLPSFLGSSTVNYTAEIDSSFGITGGSNYSNSTGISTSGWGCMSIVYTFHTI